MLVLFPSVVAVVRSACGSCFLWCGPYIVESAELMSGITPDNSDSDSTPELLEHDRGMLCTLDEDVSQAG